MSLVSFNYLEPKVRKSYLTQNSCEGTSSEHCVENVPIVWIDCEKIMCAFTEAVTNRSSFK